MEQLEFGPATRIATRRGAVTVERLRPGDALVTRSGPPVRLERITAHTRVPRLGDPCVIDFVPPFVKGRLSETLLIGPDQTILCEGPELELHFGLRRALITTLSLVRVPRPRPEPAYQLELSHPALIMANGIWCAGYAAVEDDLPELDDWEAALLLRMSNPDWGLLRHAA